jgi:cell wall-associated NlpC family hydrolase
LKLSNRFASSAGAVVLSLLILFSSLITAPQASYAATAITVGGKAVVTNTDGDSINIREGAGVENAQVAEAHEGDTVSVLAGPKKDTKGKNWYKVTAPDGTGWISAAFLEAKSSTTTSQSSSTTPKLTGFARVANTDGDPLRMRSAASKDGKVVTTLAADTIVAIKQGPLADANGTIWYQVSANGLTGWVMGQYLAQASAPAKPAAATKPATSTKPAVEAKPAAADTKPVASQVDNVKPKTVTAVQPAVQTSVAGRGDNIVSLAMKYVGYRYRYGGTTPNGFDCSGFVYYVYNKSGVSLSRDMNVQWNSGARISRDNLQPGDILFWSNTYKRGLSHVGIYIGGGKFVHAENESTGVVVSSLNTAYWASRYSGAVRPR